MSLRTRWHEDSVRNRWFSV
ncbi:TPA: Ail/Lom family outer membrane beta-barrel protein, partial [Escherichia coli]|nr:Ail/Lom family outer membrane beta-barrel protein [Escherichia coli]